MSMEDIIEKLNGEWVVEEATGSFAELNKGTVYTINGSDHFETKKSIFTSKGKILSVTENKLIVQMDGMQNPSEFDYRFEGAGLIIEPLNSGQVLTLIKRN